MLIYDRIVFPGEIPEAITNHSEPLTGKLVDGITIFNEEIVVEMKSGLAVKTDMDEIPGGRKTVKSKNGENLVFSRGGVTSVTPFPFSSAHSEG